MTTIGLARQTARMHPKNQQLGFTLIELMVTIAILAIVLGVGIPSYKDLIVNNRMAAEINDFVGSLRITRSEAIKRGLNVRICASNNVASCATTASTTDCSCASTSNWDQGWIVEVVTTGEDLRIQEALTSGNTLVGANNLARTLTFDANGFVRGDDNALPVNGTLIMLCDADNDNDKARAVEMSLTGLITIKKHADDPANVKCS